ncbi:thioester reductase domain-containing protein [Streptomyces sp. NPDC001793]|uniref:thioester reductase domain-containing protein n=1 Tax=Streptomyces sp. NPDC001793 TaxID=3154657 RepID=UPI0033345546
MYTLIGEKASIPEENLSTRFAKICARQPDKAALACAGEELSYRDLHHQAVRVAGRILTQLPVEAGTTRVGVLVERGFPMAIAIFAAMYLDAVWVPLEPGYPSERLRTICRDAGLDAVITEESFAERCDGFLPSHTPRILVDADDSEPSPAPGEPINRPVLPGTTPAYIMYTSGSTGTPKGVEVNQRGLTNYLEATRSALDLHAGDVYVHTASMAFSSSVRHLLVPLLHGGTVVISRDEERFRPEEYLGMIKESGATVLDIVPSFLKNLLDFLSHEPAARAQELADNKLRLLVIGSEPVGYDLIDRFRTFFSPSVAVTSVLGGTELSGVVSHHRLDPREPRTTSTVPIGGPMLNSIFHVVPDTPGSNVGELYVAGPALANGYLDEKLTAEKFIASNTIGVPGDATLYRTGDLVRINDDGRTLVHAGRVDRQIKVRGMRVETLDIEAHARRCPGVRDAAVVPRELQGSTRLIAYVTGEAGHPDPLAVREFLREHVPQYMVPDHIVPLDVLPLNSNGKLDVNRLPLPDENDSSSPNSFEPRNAQEAELADIWTSLLGRRTVGIDDNFFHAGGDSLLASALISTVGRKLNTAPVPLEFFSDPTFANLLGFVRDGRLSDRGQRAAQADATARLGLASPPAPGQDSPGTGDILLTGGNGFLGVHLLDRLLRATTARVHLLVRAADATEAAQKVHRAAAEYDIDLADASPRLRYLSGDLSAPRLGLDSKTWHTLASDVSAIYHCGAHVNHLLDYESLRAANVQSTIDIVRLATKERLKKVFFISTRKAANRIQEGGLAELPPLREPSASDGYVLSKWAAENLLVQAAEAGVPVDVYRPGNITGNSLTGKSNHLNNHSLMLIKGCIELGVAPDWDKEVEMVPVDRVSEAIVGLSRTRDSSSNARFFNLANPKSMTWRQYLERLRYLGHPIELIPTGEWIENHVRPIRPAHVLYPLKTFYGGTGAPDGSTPAAAVRTEATQAALEAIGLRYPDDDYDSLIARYTGYLFSENK